MNAPNTPPSSSTSPPATAGGEPRIDVVAGDPPVPVTVWRTPTGDDERASIPARLAQRLVAAYSGPGDTVVDVTDDHTLHAACTAGGRRHRRAVFTDRATLTVGPDTNPDPDPGTAARVTSRIRRGRDTGPHDARIWFGDDLTDPDPPASRAAPPPMVPAGQVLDTVTLIVACWPLHSAGDTNTTRLSWLLHAAVRLLRPGGCLVLVVHAPAGTVATPQDFGPLLRTARDAGLGYLQHIVAVHADVHGDQFTYHATETELAALAALAATGQFPAVSTADGPPAPVHLRVHADLLVLTRAGEGRG